MKRFDSREALDAALADALAADLRRAIDERGRASMAVSGGSTPRGVFRALAAQALDWARVTITLVDDRWVDPGHEDSNERLVNDHLRTGAASAARFLSLHTPDTHPRAAVDAVEERLSVLGTIDVMMLGMGADGHFASLFPDSDALEAGLDLAGSRSCIAVDPPVAPHARMSMTLPRILDCRRLILHITGADKLAVLEQARRDADPLTLPIAAVLAATAPDLVIYWAP